MQQRFCSNMHAGAWRSAQKSKGVQETYHWLSDIDEDSRTATCTQCGPRAVILSAGTKRNVDGSRKWKCKATAFHEHNLHSRWESDWRKRGIHLTAKRFEAMLEVQGRACAICRVPFPADRRPPVDHCHASGEVRGLLCSNCNTALGHFEDDIDRIVNAALYLENPPARAVP
jgi:hypothetical protein